MKRILSAAALSVALVPHAVRAAETYKFALVPKGMDNPYFDQARDGCVAEASKLGGISCIYKGPSEDQPAEQSAILQGFIDERVDGIAVSVADPATLAAVIDKARSAKIPVVTFDADAPASSRQVYVGTDNKEMGRELGRQLVKLHPTPASFATQSGDPGSDNLDQRLAGLYEVLKGAGWTEVEGSPLYCHENAATAIRQLDEIARKNPDIGAIIPIGAWALFADKDYRAFVDARRDKVKAGTFPLVMPDALPVELHLLKDGYAQVLVGQRPLKMGEKSMEALLRLVKGEAVPSPEISGLDIVTRTNVDEFIEKAVD